MLLLDELPHGFRDGGREDEVGQDALGLAFVKRADWSFSRRAHRRGPGWLGAEVLLEAVGDDVVLAPALVGDHRFDGAAKADLISRGACTHEVKEEICARH